MIGKPNTVLTSLRPRSSHSHTFLTTNTIDSRYPTHRCRRNQEGSTEATMKTRITPTAHYTTSRNLETTAKGLA